jgi:D-tyrosyl-tRNA(Tyr) deacylase
MVGVIQRTSCADVWVEGECVAKIGPGILILVGVEQDDTEDDVRYTAGKTARLRIFGDEQGNLNRSVLDTGGEVLVVSQFTLLGDTRKGRRPSFSRAAEPHQARHLYSLLIEELRSLGADVQEGVFGAMMEIKLVNDGPVTLIVDSKDKKGG